MAAARVGAASARRGIREQHVMSTIRAWVLTAGGTAAVLMGAASVSWATRGMVVRSSIRVLVLVVARMAHAEEGRAHVRTATQEVTAKHSHGRAVPFNVHVVVHVIFAMLDSILSGFAMIVVMVAAHVMVMVVILLLIIAIKSSTAGIVDAIARVEGPC